MMTVTKKAYGKLNLLLDVLGKRPDGYHEMKMIMQSVDLCDDVTVSLTETAGWSCTCDKEDVPNGTDNLALKAAEAFFAAGVKRPLGLSVHIQKRIPMQGGMAGGSADAAAVLHALNELYEFPFSLQQLMKISESVGSDVPYCVMGGTALAEGRGEILTQLPPMPPCTYVLVRPKFSVSTPELFRALDEDTVHHSPDIEKALQCLADRDLSGLCACMKNVFQPILCRNYPVIDEICSELTSHGALGACLTGTGSVVFGVFDREEAAKAAAAQLQKHFSVFLAKNV